MRAPLSVTRIATATADSLPIGISFEVVSAEQSNDNIVVGLIIGDENHFLFHTLLLFSFFAYFLASSLRCLLIPFEANTA